MHSAAGLRWNLVISFFTMSGWGGEGPGRPRSHRELKEGVKMGLTRGKVHAPTAEKVDSDSGTIQILVPPSPHCCSTGLSIFSHPLIPNLMDDVITAPSLWQQPEDRIFFFFFFWTEHQWAGLKEQLVSEPLGVRKVTAKASWWCWAARGGRIRSLSNCSCTAGTNRAAHVCAVFIYLFSFESFVFLYFFKISVFRQRSNEFTSQSETIVVCR